MKSRYLCALGVAVLSAPAAGQNLVVNGDFENGNRGWTTWRAPWSDADPGWDFANTEPGRFDAACLKLGTSTSNGSFGVYQQVPVEPGKTYRIDGYWKGREYGGPYPDPNNWYEVILLDGPWDIVPADSGPAATVESNYMYAYDNNTWPLAGDFGWIWMHDQNAPPNDQVDWNNRMGERTASGHVMTVVLKAGGTGFGGGIEAWFDEISLVEVTGDSGDGCTSFANGSFENGLTDWTTWTVSGAPNVAAIDGELEISGTGFAGGVYQQFLTGGAGNVVNVTGHWESIATTAGMAAEIIVINSDRTPVNGADEADGVNNAVVIYRNTDSAGWAGGMPFTSPDKYQVSFVAAGEVATILIRHGNDGTGATAVTVDDVRTHCVPPPGHINNLPPGFFKRTLTLNSPTMPRAVAIAQNPVTQEIYVVSNQGLPSATQLVRIDTGGAEMTYTTVSGLGSMIENVQGMTFDSDGHMYLSSKEGKLLKGTPINPDSFSFVQLFDIDDSLLGLGSADHAVAGLSVGLDGKLYINSGSASQYGYLVNGTPETFAGKFNARILRCNLDGSALEVFAEGIRNMYDLNHTLDGRLFGVGNGPNINCDYAEEFALLEQGNHYGFPYEMASDLSGGDNSIYPCNNGPGGSVDGPPAKPPGLVTTPSWGNYGPDAKPGPGDLGYVDGMVYYGFDPHRSPDGLDFYDPSQMDPNALLFPAGLHHRAFVAHFGELEPIPAVGHDVTTSRLDSDHDGFLTNTFLTGFSRPIDVLCAYNGAVYILDFNFSGASTVHEISYTVPTTPRIVLSTDTIDRQVDYLDNLPDETFTISNGGVGTLNYAVSEFETWMSVAPGGGSSTGELNTFTIQYDVSSLPIGEHVGTIIIEDTGSSPVPAANSPQVITVTVNVRSVRGDFDLDGDVDMDDYSHLQNCFSDVIGFPPPPGCEDALLDDDVDVDAQDVILFEGCMSGMNVLANKHCDDLQQFVRDETRGGAMYDNWWVVAGLPAPSTDHPLWQFRPDQVTNTAAGSATHRCKECHGWDYKGADGAYGSGSHHTGFPGIEGTNLSPLQVFLTLKLSHNELPNGHSFGDLGMSDQDLWDLTEFVNHGVIDTDLYVDGSKNILGNTTDGSANYTAVCNVCHGSDGTGFLPSGHDTLGQIGMDNPWELLHKIRFGQPGSPMPTAESSEWNLTDVVDTGAYVQTLPGGQVP